MRSPNHYGLGDFPLEGKTILLHAEQGLGDTLQFCRYVPMVSKLGAKVVLEAPAELLRLLGTLEGIDRLIESGQPLPPFDYQCPLLSLPLASERRPAAFPRRRLICRPTRVPRTAGATVSPDDAGTRLKVGLVWAGGNRAHVPELRKNDARRSIRLDMLTSLFDVPHVQFFSLQKGDAAQQLSQLQERNEASRRIVDYTDELGDFADTAALVANLDLVMSVDTSTAHLAGALAKPVWILNRFDTCWRWMLERSDTPWYRDARLFRQPALGAWEPVIRDVRDALVKLADR